jgi:hypothetical protein
MPPAKKANNATNIAPFIGVDALFLPFIKRKMQYINIASARMIMGM